jgi:hypothetical protein
LQNYNTGYVQSCCLPVCTLSCCRPACGCGGRKHHGKRHHKRHETKHSKSEKK